MLTGEPEKERRSLSAKLEENALIFLKYIQFNYEQKGLKQKKSTIQPAECGMYASLALENLLQTPKISFDFHPERSIVGVDAEGFF